MPSTETEMPHQAVDTTAIAMLSLLIEVKVGEHESPPDATITIGEFYL